MSCSTAPSCSHCQRIPCSGSSKVVLQCLIRSGEVPSMSGALPEAKLSITLLSASTDGSVSLAHPWWAGMQSMTSCSG